MATEMGDFSFPHTQPHIGTGARREAHKFNRAPIATSLDALSKHSFSRIPNNIPLSLFSLWLCRFASQIKGDFSSMKAPRNLLRAFNYVFLDCRLICSLSCSFYHSPIQFIMTKTQTKRKSRIFIIIPFRRLVPLAASHVPSVVYFRSSRIAVRADYVHLLAGGRKAGSGARRGERQEVPNE